MGTQVQAAPVAAVVARAWELAGEGLAVALDSGPTDTWMALAREIEGENETAFATRCTIMRGVRAATAYATVMLGGEACAVANAVCEGDWLGLFNVGTLPEARRKGAAGASVQALVEWGMGLGATQTCLQVMEQNVGALALYHKLGYSTIYRYHYRE